MLASGNVMAVLCMSPPRAAPRGLDPGTQNGPAETIRLEGLRAAMRVQLLCVAPAWNEILQDLVAGVGIYFTTLFFHLFIYLFI